MFTCCPRALRPINSPLISLVVTAVGHPSDTIGPGEGSVGLVNLVHAQCLSTLTTLTSHFTPAAAHHTHAEYDCSDAPDACDSDSWLCVMRDRCMMILDSVYVPVSALLVAVSSLSPAAAGGRFVPSIAAGARSGTLATLLLSLLSITPASADRHCPLHTALISPPLSTPTVISPPDLSEPTADYICTILMIITLLCLIYITHHRVVLFPDLLRDSHEEYSLTGTEGLVTSSFPPGLGYPPGLLPSPCTPRATSLDSEISESAAEHPIVTPPRWLYSPFDDSAVMRDASTQTIISVC